MVVLGGGADSYYTSSVGTVLGCREASMRDWNTVGPNVGLEYGRLWALFSSFPTVVQERDAMARKSMRLVQAKNEGAYS